jgi:hypothetical protein
MIFDASELAGNTPIHGCDCPECTAIREESAHRYEIRTPAELAAQAPEEPPAAALALRTALEAAGWGCEADVIYQRPGWLGVAYDGPDRDVGIVVHADGEGRPEAYELMIGPGSGRACYCGILEAATIPSPEEAMGRWEEAGDAVTSSRLLTPSDALKLDRLFEVPSDLAARGDAGHLTIGMVMAGAAILMACPPGPARARLLRLLRGIHLEACGLVRGAPPAHDETDPRDVEAALPLALNSAFGTEHLSLHASCRGSNRRDLDGSGGGGSYRG